MSSFQPGPSSSQEYQPFSNDADPSASSQPPPSAAPGNSNHGLPPSYTPVSDFNGGLQYPAATPNQQPSCPYQTPRWSSGTAERSPYRVDDGFAEHRSGSNLTNPSTSHPKVYTLKQIVALKLHVGGEISGFGAAVRLSPFEVHIIYVLIHHCNDAHGRRLTASDIDKVIQYMLGSIDEVPTTAVIGHLKEPHKLQAWHVEKLKDSVEQQRSFWVACATNAYHRSFNPMLHKNMFFKGKQPNVRDRWRRKVEVDIRVHVKNLQPPEPQQAGGGLVDGQASTRSGGQLEGAARSAEPITKERENYPPNVGQLSPSRGPLTNVQSLPADFDLENLFNYPLNSQEPSSSEATLESSPEASGPGEAGPVPSTQPVSDIAANDPASASGIDDGYMLQQSPPEESPATLPLLDDDTDLASSEPIHDGDAEPDGQWAGSARLWMERIEEFAPEVPCSFDHLPELGPHGPNY